MSTRLPHPKHHLSLLALSFACLAVPFGVAAEETILVPKQAAWLYDDTGTDLGTAWRNPGYDDSGWGEGPAFLGYGEAYIITTISYGPDPDDRHPTTYFRFDFNVVDPSAFVGMTMRVSYDDGFVAYLNGVEIERSSSMPAGTITYDTFASSHEAGVYEPYDLTGDLGTLVTGSNVLAVELHQRSPTNNDLALDLELVGSDVPTLTRGPYLQMVTPSSVVLRWRTNIPTGSTVLHGETMGNLLPATDSTPKTEHEMTLSGLTADTSYFYAVLSSEDTLAGPDSAHTFSTAPSPGTIQPIRIWVTGDSGKPGTKQRAVRDAYLDYTTGTTTDLWLILGDNAYDDGTNREYQEGLFDPFQEILRNTPVWPTRGNHDDIHSGDDNDYYDFFTLPAMGEAGGVPSTDEAYYSFDWGNAHFVCLDSEGSDNSPGGAMMTWLQSDLASTAQDWLIAFWHHPPYSKGSHDSDTEGDLIDMRVNALPILEDAGVDLVLSGHSHSYERSFLLDEHYGVSTTLHDSMKVDPGDGRPSGTGAYMKPTAGMAPHEGAVYAVTGSSSKRSSGSLDHPVMVASLYEYGSMILDIDGDQLDAVFLNDGGDVLDNFTVIKGGGTTTVAGGSPAVAGPAIWSHPNPITSSGAISYRLPVAGRVEIAVFDGAGRKVATLVDGRRPAGLHRADWDGRDTDGRRVATGVYFFKLSAAGVERTGKLAVVR